MLTRESMTGNLNSSVMQVPLQCATQGPNITKAGRNFITQELDELHLFVFSLIVKLIIKLLNIFSHI